MQHVSGTLRISKGLNREAGKKHSMLKTHGAFEEMSSNDQVWFNHKMRVSNVPGAVGGDK